MISARELSFEELSYSGTYQNGTLTLGIITLNVGYNEDVEFHINGGGKSKTL